jgi:predicted nucleic acid-binding protein
MLAFDSSALVKRYQEEEHSEWLGVQMEQDTDWCGSSLLAPETAISISRTFGSPGELASADLRLSRDLEFFDLLPIDADCLVEAIELARGLKLRTLDALHLAAISKLPAGCRFITFDDRQTRAAGEIGIKLLAPA